MNLSNHHASTLREIFSHDSENVEWRKVRSLLEAVGTVEQRHDGHLEVTIGPETEVVHVPREKDVDRQRLVDLRRMLEQAGITPDSTEPVADTRDRDFGDSRWGEPK
ncbi:hypothetical protein HJD18_13310 [Thermoleophilia bacterium SCSIO 60948]|nr:hypothetical protein HJD18_13310 [Thermoleophilia bacterium SCSIO 60948]